MLFYVININSRVAQNHTHIQYTHALLLYSCSVARCVCYSRGAEDTDKTVRYSYGDYRLLYYNLRTALTLPKHKRVCSHVLLGQIANIPILEVVYSPETGSPIGRISVTIKSEYIILLQNKVLREDARFFLIKNA